MMNKKLIMNEFLLNMARNGVTECANVGRYGICAPYIYLKVKQKISY